MSGSTDNIEGVARAICAKVLARDGKSDEKLTAEVDMYWHVVAAEDWQNAAALSVLCTIPDDEATGDASGAGVHDVRVENSLAA